MSNLVSIPEFYAGKHVFVTGGTGFIGKVLLEKLLRSCPQVAGVHCLVRPKRGKAAKERLEAIAQEEMFDRLRREQPEFLHKLHAIPGDVMEPSLGMTPADQDFLEKNISIIFHSAATIKFDEKMRIALELNLLGTRKMIHLARHMVKLEVFLHVSTAYANCDRKYMDEILYPPPVRPQKILDMLSWADEELLDTLTPYMIGKKPNTYTYTKQLAEGLLEEEAKGLPLAMVRPSIVTASLKEPLPGWIDNWNGPSGLYIACGKGFLRTFHGDKRAVADLVPVDLLVNAMISVAWSTAICKTETIKVYHVTSGDLNPLTWGFMEKECIKAFYDVPMEGLVGAPISVITSSRVLHFFRTYLCHWLPAYSVDTICRLIGRKPSMVRTYDKLHKGIAVLSFFTNHTWQWTNNNLMELQDTMLPQDKKDFPFDPRSISWSAYLKNYCIGVKKFVMKEKMSNITAARMQLKRIYRIEVTFRIVTVVIVWKLLISRSELFRKYWFYLVSLLIQLLQKTGLLQLLSKTGLV